jgi:hypothetical protein
MVRIFLPHILVDSMPEMKSASSEVLPKSALVHRESMRETLLWERKSLNELS